MFCFKDDHDPTLGMFVGLTGGGGGGGVAYALSVTSQITNTVREIEELVNNTNPAVTQADLAANGYGFYRGRLVVKLDIMGRAAFSFGIIFTGPKPSGNLLDHEYGHTVHLDQIGVVNYFTKVALPSIISFWIYNNNPYYESQPWEYIAEYFGKTVPPPDGYLKCADELALLYWLYTFLP